MCMYVYIKIYVGYSRHEYNTIIHDDSFSKKWVLDYLKG